MRKYAFASIVAAVVVATTLVFTLSSEATGTLIGHWTFDDGTATDISGNGNNGVVNGAILAAGKVGVGSLNFDGTDDYVDLGTLDPGGSAVTLAAWVNSDDLANCGASDCRIVSKATGVQDQDHNIMLSTIDSGGGVKLRFRLKAGGVTSTLLSSVNLADGQWTHVAGTYDGSNMRVYVNGAEVGSVAKTGAVDSNPAVPFWIGGNPDSPTSRPWNGKIDDVRIYDGALTLAEIRALAGGSPSIVQKIYWGDTGSNKIQRANLDGSNQEDLIVAGVDPNGVAVAPAGGQLFWADESNGGCCIGSSDLDGTNQNVVSPSEGRMIAVDEEDDWLFWISSGSNDVLRSRLDGTEASSIGSAGTGIALDESANIVYWATPGSAIGKMNYDGSGVTQIFGSVESASVYDLDYDPVSGMLFWADESNPGTIRKGFPDGTGFQEIVSDAGQALGIAVDGLAGKVYWSDRTGFIKRANLDGSNIETVVSGLSDPLGVALGPVGPIGVPLPQPTTGGGSPLMGRGTFNRDVDTGTVSFMEPDSGGVTTNPGNPAAAEAQIAILTPNVDGLASDFVIKSDTAPGLGNSVQFVFRIDGVDTGFGCQLNATETECDTGIAMLFLPAASQIAIKIVAPIGVQPDPPMGLKFGWLWTQQ